MSTACVSLWKQMLQYIFSQRVYILYKKKKNKQRKKQKKNKLL